MKEADSRDLEGAVGAGRVRRGRRGFRRQAQTRVRTDGASSLEQVLRENASALTFLGVTLGVFVSRKFLILPVAIGLMLAQEKLVEAGLDRVQRAVRR
jgi:hypothetical protein